MEQLKKTLDSAGSSERSIRKPAEEQLKKWENNHFGQYLIGLCQVLGDPNNPKQIRQLAGLQVGQLVGGGRTKESQDVLTKRYFNLSLETRATIRASVTPVLGSDLPEARKTAAIIVAKIAAVELPKGLWSDLIPMLEKVVSGSNTDFRQSALQTLRYIGEESNCEVMDQYAGTILNCVKNGVSDNNLRVRLAAVNAMLHCLEYVEKNFELKDHRNLIIEMIIICAQTPGSDREAVGIKVAGFQCMAEVAKNYYKHMGDSIDLMAQITMTAMQREHEDVRKMAIEFWTCVFEEEIEIEKEKKASRKNWIEITKN